MKVIALRSFVDINHGSVARGAEIDLPDGVNWLNEGLVTPAGDPAPESAMLEKPKPKTTRKRRTRKKPAAKKET